MTEIELKDVKVGDIILTKYSYDFGRSYLEFCIKELGSANRFIYLGDLEPVETRLRTERNYKIN